MEKKRNFRKKITKVFMVMAVVLGCFYATTITSYAYTQTTGTVIPATAKIRAEANTSSAVVGSTAVGKTVSITDEVKAADGSVWYQIFLDATTKGYIRSDLVTKAGGAAPAAIEPETAKPETQTPKPEAAVAVTNMDWQSGKVASNSVRVRKNASTTSDLVATVGRGTTITVTGKSNGADGKEWYQVSFAYNNATITGFIRSDLVTFGELPEESPEPAVTEITGSKTEEAASGDTKKKADAEESPEPATTEPETTEPETEATSEVTPEPETETAEPEAEQQQAAPATTITVLNAEEEPPLAPGFKEVAVTLNEEKVKAWKNGDFYIFYGQSTTGEMGFYMYDSIETTYQRYYMSNIDDAGKQGGISDNVLKIIMIVLGILVVVLLVVVTLLTIKLNDYKSEMDWDDDGDDDFPDDDDEEEDEEDEEIVSLPRRVKKQTPVREEPKRRPQAEEPRRRPQAEEPKGRPQAEEPRRRPQAEEPKRRPQAGGEQRKPSRPNGESGNRPRNFLAEDVEGRRTAVKTGKDKKREPVLAELDPDDEDTFVFINLDGDQID